MRAFRLWRRSGGHYRSASGLSGPPFWLSSGSKLAQVHAPATAGSGCVYVEILGDDLYQCGAWLKRLPSNPTVIDLGANYGLFSCWMRLLHPGADIIAVEPNPEVLAFLLQNSREFNFAVIPKAFSQTSEAVLLSLENDSTLAHVVSSDQSSKAARVEGICARQLLEMSGPRIDLLKCDCEGAERWLLEEGAFLQSVGALVMEYHLEHVAEIQVLKALRDAGFRILSNRSGQVSGHLVAVRT